MLVGMNQYKLIWQSTLSTKQKITKYNSLVWGKGKWSLHLHVLTRANQVLIDGAQARHIRRITGTPAAFISRVSHKKVRKKVKLQRASTSVFKAQLQWLGHILRKPTNDPLRVVLFGPEGGLNPYRPRYGKRKRGRPNHEWAEHLFNHIYSLIQMNRTNFQKVASDRVSFNKLVERLCVLHLS